MAVNEAKIETNETRINSLEKKVEVIENQVDGLEKSQGVIGVYLEKSNEIQEKSNIIQKELSDAIVSIQIALGKFSSDLSYSIKKTEEVSANLNDFKREVKGELDQIGKSVETIDHRGKFDFIDFVRAKVIPSLLGGGALWALYKAVEMLILETHK